MKNQSVALRPGSLVHAITITPVSLENAPYFMADVFARDEKALSSTIFASEWLHGRLHCIQQPRASQFYLLDLREAAFKIAPMKRSLALSLAISLLALFEADARRIAWNTNPVSGDWYTAANWRQGVVPNGQMDTASFGASSVDTVTFPTLSQTTLSHIVFQFPTGISYLDISPGASVTLQGTGITGSVLGVSVLGDTTSGPGTLTLRKTAVYGVATSGSSLGVSGALLFYDQSSIGANSLYDSGQVEFHDQSSANGTLILHDSDEVDMPAAVLIFAEQAKAVGVNITTFGSSDSTSGLQVYFNDDSTANGSLFASYAPMTTYDVSGHNLPGLAIGSLGVVGDVFLGTNNLSTQPSFDVTFFGSLHDGGASGGTGGSFTLLPAVGSQTFTGPSDYPGGTVVEGSTFYANSSRGSTTGSGPVQVNGGKLAGHGIIAGAVTVGAGIGQTATLGAGGSGSVTGQTLTIQQGLTFRADGIYAATLNGNKQVANKVAAKGVTVEAGTQITLTDTREGIVPPGTVFVLISNTATTPIAGRFSNLADGATITAGHNIYQASYEGDDGNDLTLTVQ